jgi:transcriptional regulator GlxA family with amidase domain
MAIREMHGDPARAWTAAQLAKTAALSRSAFFDRFLRAMGMSPMEYLLAWRMMIAKDLLRTQKIALDEVARRVGYGSASTFSMAFSRQHGLQSAAWPSVGSMAFSRHVGQPPGQYARTTLDQILIA